MPRTIRLTKVLQKLNQKTEIGATEFNGYTLFLVAYRITKLKVKNERSLK